MILTKQRLTALAVIATSALAVTGIADAATKSTSKHKTHAVKCAASGTTGATGAGGRAHNETPLTGDTLKRASGAAIAANPGATVNRASTEDPAEGTGAAYEVKITKADGTRTEVLESSSFAVASTKADGGRHGGPGRGGNPNEKELTGDDLTKATAAAKSAVPGGTVDRASAEDPAEGNDAAYEVHVTKADGSRVEVLLDSSFGVVKTVDDQGPGGPGRRHR